MRRAILITTVTAIALFALTIIIDIYAVLLSTDLHVSDTMGNIIRAGLLAAITLALITGILTGLLIWLERNDRPR